jgi:hypothetical protein
MAERDENGKFAKGNPGGPGRPKKEREERFTEITLSAVTFKDWEEIIKKAVTQAKRGDAQARKFLADYLIGPPVQRNEHTGANGGPLAVGMVEIVKDYGGAE